MKTPSSMQRISISWNLEPFLSWEAGWPMSSPFFRFSISILWHVTFLIPSCVHSISRDLATPDMGNRKRTGERLSPCLTPLVCGTMTSSLPALIVTERREQSLPTIEHKAGGAPYLSSTSNRILCTEVSQALTRSTKVVKDSRLCCLRRWRRVFNVKFASWQPTLGVAPNCVLTPFLSSRVQARSVSMQLRIYEHTSIRLMHLHLFRSCFPLFWYQYSDSFVPFGVVSFSGPKGDYEIVDLSSVFVVQALESFSWDSIFSGAFAIFQFEYCFGEFFPGWGGFRLSGGSLSLSDEFGGVWEVVSAGVEDFGEVLFYCFDVLSVIAW